MIDNIVEFPTKSIRDWKVTSDLMLQILKRRGLNDKQASEFVSTFKPIYDLFQLEIQIRIPTFNPILAAQLDKALSEMQLAIQDHTTKLIMERFTRELDIFVNKL